MELETFIKELDKLIPFETALETDKLGLQIKSTRKEITKILVTYEVTEETILEIEQIKPECILAFHPLIYAPLTTINTDERVGKIVWELAKLDTSLVICHTNFDAYKFGTSWLFAHKIGLNIEDFLSPNLKYPNFGIGVIGKFEPSISVTEFLDRIFRITNSPIRWNRGKKEFITKVGILGGSGVAFADIAYDKSMDAYITSDISYHNFHKFNGKMMLVDPGHWELEYMVAFGLGRLLHHHFNSYGISIYVSKVYSNPIKYFPNIDLNQKQKEMLSFIQENL